MDAGAIRCASCGGPVAPDDVRCRSCGTQVATVACPNCMAMVSVHASHCEHCGAAIVPAESIPTDLSCPECRSARLTQTSLGEVAVDQCLHCGGVWLDQMLFEKITTSKDIRGQALGVLPAPPANHVAASLEIHYRPCPVCAQMMNRYNYARISGVIVDGCKKHGLWFDKDELRQVLEFISGGGLEKSREREIAKLEEEKRTLASMTRMDLSSMPSASGDYTLLGGRSVGSTSLLSHLVDGLMEHFII